MQHISKIIKLDYNSSEQEILDCAKQAVSILNQGGVIIFPTETVYGIGAHIQNKTAINKIYEIKKRDLSKPLSYHIGSLEQININVIPEKYNSLIKKYWPGPMTLIYNDYEKNEVLGVRYPSCKIFLKISNLLKSPIAGTSANLSNTKSAWEIDSIEDEILQQVDLIIDAGATEYKGDSTILDITGDNYKIVREGVINKFEIENLMNL